ncbi:VCBS repeat-containing protein [Streptomyces sp. NPDC050738]|uniref:FG-GAP repeat domain-containing protein n=1 Tax=Streptomyces sp. NPDC050738 TaxID=3154744 RepID=UPI0034222400
MRKSKIRFISAALIPTLTLGAVGAGAATALVTASSAAAATAGERLWDTPAPLTKAGEANSVKDVKTTTDGTAVMVWVRTLGKDREELWSATRPADATAWNAPVRVDDTQNSGVYDVDLTVGKDGSATVAWELYGSSGYTYSTASLAAGAAAWTVDGEIPGVDSPGLLAAASGPGGSLVAVWSTYGEGAVPKGTYVFERTAPGAAWSAPVKLADDPVLELAVTVAGDGRATIAWDYNALTVVSRAPGSDTWSAPVEVKKSGLLSRVTLQSSVSGATLLSWSNPSSLGDDYSFSYRPAGSEQWGAPETTPAGSYPDDSGAPVLDQNGEVTMAWQGTSTSSLSTATRSASGTWSATQNLAESAVNQVWSPSIGADGTVTLLWTNSEGQLTSSHRALGGSWTSPVLVGRTDADRKGFSASGNDGRAFAVWNRNTATEGDTAVQQVWATATGSRDPATPSKRRDYVGNDGFPDLYARGTDGSLVVYQGKASGVVSAKADGGTWPDTSTVIPFGDLNGDGTNDTLVTDTAGDLYRYTPVRSKPVSPDAPSTRIGTGWQGYDGLTYSGDFTGDGLPDLVARQTATGDLYLYAGTKAGGLTRTGKIGNGWTGLTIVGAGDLNGDKAADLVARTANGDLYRYYGTGKGTVGSGVKIGNGWGSMADFVGIGDLTGDGKDDILGRTTAGDLYRYAGTGAGTIGSGVKIGSGWKSFRSIS